MNGMLYRDELVAEALGFRELSPDWMLRDGDDRIYRKSALCFCSEATPETEWMCIEHIRFFEQDEWDRFKAALLKILCESQPTIYPEDATIELWLRFGLNRPGDLANAIADVKQAEEVKSETS